MTNTKGCLITGIICLSLGIISWIVGGRADKVMLLYIFPRSALGLGLTYFLWACSFFFFGVVFGGIALNCDRFKKRENGKILLFLIFAFIFSFCVYPVFFKSMAPFISFLILLTVELFCILAFMACIRVYSLWSMLLSVYMLWIFYNCYLTLAIAIIN